MYTLAEIRALATIIKNETRRFFNTGARIDEVIQAIIDHIDYLGQEGVCSLWEIGEGDILLPKDDRTFTIKKANEVDVIGGGTDKFLNEQGDFTTINTYHKDLENKNAEPEFQHVTQEEKTGFHTHPNKEYLDNYNPTLFATALEGEKADSALESLPPNTVIDADYPTLKDKVNGIEVSLLI